MNYDIKLVPVKSLRPSPKTLAVHTQFDPSGRDSLLVESIREKGILEPLKVKPDGVIEDGYRRSECAKFLKIAKVPAVILEDGVEIFEDMQLGRQLTLFAICTMQRVRIENLVQRGKQLRGNQKSATVVEDRKKVDEEWEKLERIFGKKRDTLRIGCSALVEIDQLRLSDPKKADKAEARFREHGVEAAKRFTGSWGMNDAAAEGAETDVADWDSESDEEPSPEPEKTTTRTVATDKRIDRSHAKHKTSKQLAWQSKWLKLLDQLAALVPANSRHKEEMRDWLRTGKEFAATKTSAKDRATVAVADDQA